MRLTPTRSGEYLATMTWIYFVVPLLLAVIIHEVAHGYVAWKLGDSTAKNLGRLTLNPLPHISLMGTIVVPAILIVSKAPILFGWAKPVPVQSQHFKNPDRDMAWVAIAGPVSNFAQALIYAAVIFLTKATVGFESVQTAGPLVQAVILISTYGILINIVLGMFNLTPIPPLDGSRIVMALLPQRLRPVYGRLEQYGLLVVILVVFLAGDYIFIPIRWVLKWVGVGIGLS